jgi:hypothetical protein
MNYSLDHRKGSHITAYSDEYTELVAPRYSSFLSHHGRLISQPLPLETCRKSWNTDLQEPVLETYDTEIKIRLFMLAAKSKLHNGFNF